MIELSPEESESLAEQHGLVFDPEVHEIQLHRGTTRLGHLVIGANTFVIVEGDLVVDGPIIDFYPNNDDVSRLVVTGNVSAANMITGQSLEIHGSLDVRELWFVLAWDDLNSIRVGSAVAKAFVSIGANPISATTRRFGRVFDSLDPEATTHTLDEILLPGVLDPKQRKNLRALHEAMLKNAPVTR